MALSPTVDALVAPVRRGGRGAQVGGGGRAAQVVGDGRLRGGGEGGWRNWTRWWLVRAVVLNDFSFCCKNYNELHLRQAFL